MPEVAECASISCFAPETMNQISDRSSLGRPCAEAKSRAGVHTLTLSPWLLRLVQSRRYDLQTSRSTSLSTRCWWEGAVSLVNVRALERVRVSAFDCGEK